MNNEKKIDGIFSDYNNPAQPGAAVMVIKDGKIDFHKGYGLANVELALPIDAFTNFRLASITKQFTAMSILLLIKAGELQLTTTLNEIFPGYPGYGKKINIKYLLQHTSGLIDYEDLIHDSVTIQLKDKDVLDLMMQTDSTYFEPGSNHKYSNSGYALLALTVEKFSGKPFRDFLKENVFQPLGMNNTIAFENNINEVANRAYGYTITDKEIDLTDQSITSAVLGDGGIYSSLNDLYTWDQSLYTEDLIEKKYLAESWTPGITSEGDEFPYGYGWHLEKRYNSEAVYHTGSTKGFRNIIYRIPDRNFTIVILTNRNAGPERITLDLAYKIADFYFGVK
ncbi:MAG TPA: serine hydrolase domain-containing protein [Ignavibacteriaceae bacterium]|nr:serine hydrolase domain-containing protein [Ignavibacteriaceae bacterium]